MKAAEFAIEMVDNARENIDGEPAVVRAETVYSDDSSAQVSIEFNDGTRLNIDIFEAQ